MAKTEVMQELEMLGSGLGSMPRTMPYEVPEAYFESLSGQISAAASLEEITVHLPKANPFAVPDAYFQELPAAVMAAVKNEEKPKVKTIDITAFVRKYATLAAAAVVLLVAGAGVFRMAMQQNSFEHQLASIPEESIKEYMVQSAGELDAGNAVVYTEKLPAQLTEEEIEAYLDETGWQ